jgi:hypothetical protein
MVSSNAPRRDASPPRPLRAPPRLAIRRGVTGHLCQIKFWLMQLIILAAVVLWNALITSTSATTEASAPEAAEATATTAATSATADEPRSNPKRQIADTAAEKVSEKVAVSQPSRPPCRSR